MVLDKTIVVERDRGMWRSSAGKDFGGLVGRRMMREEERHAGNLLCHTLTTSFHTVPSQSPSHILPHTPLLHSSLNSSPLHFVIFSERGAHATTDPRKIKQHADADVKKFWKVIFLGSLTKKCKDSSTLSAFQINRHPFLDLPAGSDGISGCSDNLKTGEVQCTNLSNLQPGIYIYIYTYQIIGAGLSPPNPHFQNFDEFVR